MYATLRILVSHILERFPIWLSRSPGLPIPLSPRMSESGCSTDSGGCMAGPYSADLRERVVGAVSEGATRRRAGAAFKVSASTAIRWAQRFQETGSWQARPSGGDQRSRAIEAHREWLLALVAAEPDLMLKEIRERLTAEKAFAGSISSLWRFFHRHGISFKKSPARG